MYTLTAGTFHQWLASYSQASTENNPQASADLFAHDAHYYETPFVEPMIGREAIHDYWLKGTQTLQDKESAFEILAIQAQHGIARWRSAFTVIASGKRLALDCLFVVEFNKDGLCQTFREWWHLQEKDK